MFSVCVLSRRVMQQTRLVSPVSLITPLAYSTSLPVFKDKSFKDSGSGPRKSKFTDSNADKVKKFRTEEETTKLKDERAAREEKKKEIHKRQMEIQKKRDEAQAAKAPTAMKKKVTKHGKDDD